MNNYSEEELAKLRASGAEVQRIRSSALHELDMARQLRAEAEKYRRETETKARSQAQMLILQARLAVRQEVAELRRKTGEEIQKVLVDIRIMRITAQKELETLQKINTASKIQALSSTTRTKPIKAPREKEAISA